MKKKKKENKKEIIKVIGLFMLTLVGVVIYTRFVASKYPGYYIGRIIVWLSVSAIFTIVIVSGIMKNQIEGVIAKRIVVGVLLILLIVINCSVLPFYMDIPNFLNKNYITTTGVISDKWHSTGKYSDHSTHIIIDNKRYIVVENSQDIKVGDRVILEYLPHSHVIKAIKLKEW